MLTKLQLQKLNTDLKTYNVSVQDISKELGISTTAVYNILNGKVQKAKTSIEKIIEVRDNAKQKWIDYLNDKNL